MVNTCHNGGNEISITENSYEIVDSSQLVCDMRQRDICMIILLSQLPVLIMDGAPLDSAPTNSGSYQKLNFYVDGM
jgi:hypothetical protein